MSVRGVHFVAGVAEAGDGPAFTATEPLTGAAMPPAYRDASSAQVQRACAAADAAAVPFAATPPTVRARLLRAIADGLLELGDE
ncbi:MAG: aldehyde dehydrogenase (NADP(+)), partial [Planctomycetota bacterium]